MTHFQSFTKKLLSAMMAAALVVPAMATTSYAAGKLPTKEGTYSVDVELSLYITAMGGVEFAEDATTKANIVTGTKVTVDEGNNVSMTLSLGTTTGNIYGIDFTGFVDATDATPGYYDASGTKKDATYTKSTNTAATPSGSANYVDSITFPVTEATDSYYLYLYFNSNVMGKQFEGATGTAAEGGHAILSVDWDSLEETLPIVDTSTSNAEIVYEYSSEPTYEIEIPKNLDLGTTSNGEGSYNIVLNTAVNFAEGDYITVSAPESGELVSGTYKTTYTNTLATHKLTKATDSVSGSVKVATPPASGTYKGTLTFTINLHSNSK